MITKLDQEILPLLKEFLKTKDTVVSRSFSEEEKDLLNELSAKLKSVFYFKVSNPNSLQIEITPNAEANRNYAIFITLLEGWIKNYKKEEMFALLNEME